MMDYETAPPCWLRLKQSDTNLDDQVSIFLVTRTTVMWSLSRSQESNHVIGTSHRLEQSLTGSSRPQPPRPVPRCPGLCQRAERTPAGVRMGWHMGWCLFATFGFFVLNLPHEPHVVVGWCISHHFSMFLLSLLFAHPMVARCRTVSKLWKAWSAQLDPSSGGTLFFIRRSFGPKRVLNGLKHIKAANAAHLIQYFRSFTRQSICEACQIWSNLFAWDHSPGSSACQTPSVYSPPRSSSASVFPRLYARP